MRTKVISWLAETHPELKHLWRGEWKAGRLEPARILHDHELVAVLRGSCRVEIEGRGFELAAGGWIIVPPAKNHSTVAGPSGVARACLHFNWVPFRGRRPSAICCFYPERPKPGQVAWAPAMVPRGILHGQFPLDGPLPGLLETIFHRWRKSDAFSRQLASVGLQEVFVRLLMSPASARREAGASGRIAYAAREILEGERGSPEGIQQQLERLGLSYAHVSRLFRKTFGLTPVEYRNAVRLERAKALLRDPRLTVAQVAYATGFDDPAYFTRLFRRQNGVPPSAFRQA
jgi:AraC-like DNA-binding protein